MQNFLSNEPTVRKSIRQQMSRIGNANATAFKKFVSHSLRFHADSSTANWRWVFDFLWFENARVRKNFKLRKIMQILRNDACQFRFHWFNSCISLSMIYLNNGLPSVLLYFLYDYFSKSQKPSIKVVIVISCGPPHQTTRH